MTSQQCTIPDCNEFAEGDTTPALCPVHLDLDILVDFAVARGQEPTLENIQHHYLIARSNSGFWTLVFDQIEPLLPGLLAARGLTLDSVADAEAVAEAAGAKAATVARQQNSRHVPVPATKESTPVKE